MYFSANKLGEMFARSQPLSLNYGVLDLKDLATSIRGYQKLDDNKVLKEAEQLCGHSFDASHNNQKHRVNDGVSTVLTCVCSVCNPCVTFSSFKLTLWLVGSTTKFYLCIFQRPKKTSPTALPCRYGWRKSLASRYALSNKILFCAFVLLTYIILCCYFAAHGQRQCVCVSGLFEKYHETD
jgi:hypothetical protein